MEDLKPTLNKLCRLTLVLVVLLALLSILAPTTSQNTNINIIDVEPLELLIMLLTIITIAVIHIWGGTLSHILTLAISGGACGLTTGVLTKHIHHTQEPSSETFDERDNEKKYLERGRVRQKGASLDDEEDSLNWFL